MSRLMGDHEDISASMVVVVWRGGIGEEILDDVHFLLRAVDVIHMEGVIECGSKELDRTKSKNTTQDALIEIDRFDIFDGANLLSFGDDALMRDDFVRRDEIILTIPSQDQINKPQSLYRV